MQVNACFVAIFGAVFGLLGMLPGTAGQTNIGATCQPDWTMMETIISMSCNNGGGNFIRSAINLDIFIADVGGAMVEQDGGGIAATCNTYGKLGNWILSANCMRPDNTLGPASFDLTTLLSNRDGILCVENYGPPNSRPWCGDALGTEGTN